MQKKRRTVQTSSKSKLSTSQSNKYHKPQYQEFLFLGFALLVLSWSGTSFIYNLTQTAECIVAVTAMMKFARV
jgi:hypothetical protein